MIRLIPPISQETFLFVKDDVVFDGVALQGFLVGNITQGDPLGGDGYVALSMSLNVLGLDFALSL